MSSYRLRTLSRDDILWRQTLAGWRARGVEVALDQPPGATPLIEVKSEDGLWSALLDPRQWLAQTAPALAAMAAGACDDGQLLALFNSLPRPLTFDHDQLGYHQLRATGLVQPADIAKSAVPRLAAQECPVWVTQYDADKTLGQEIHWQGLLELPLSVDFCLGASRLTADMVAELEAGDVLLIARLARELKCYGHSLGRFSQHEEMIMIEENYEEYPLSEDEQPDSPPAQGLVETLIAAPLKVEFILQRRFLTVGEVQQLFSGKVLELDPAAEKSVELRASGRLLARGELVQLEDRLGVELMELYPDTSYDL